MKTRKSSGLAAGLILTLAVAGCSGDPDMIRAVPAAGTVTYKGKPLETGNIQFHAEKGRSASGAIKDGKFVLTTYEDGDGAVPGKHAVVVSASKEVRVPAGPRPSRC
jgi:hypothetical protein